VTLVREALRRIEHRPWPLQRGEVELETNSMLDACGLGQGAAPPLVHYAERIDVVVWDACEVRVATGA